MSDIRERLLTLLAERSYLRGDFILTSGKRSNVYLDTKLTSTSAVGMTLIGPAFLDLFAAEGWWKPDAVIGMTLSADPILGAISYASALANDPLDHIIVRKEAKRHGTSKQMEGRTEGIRRVIVIDDVWTTGGSTIQAIEVAREAKMEIVGAATLVDRERGASEAIHPIPSAALFTLAEIEARKH